MSELARRQVPRAMWEPTGIHVEQHCTPTGPSSQGMLCNPSLNYLSQGIQRTVERLVMLLLLFLFFFTTLPFFFRLSLPLLKVKWFPLPTGHCWFVQASSQYFFKWFWHLFWLVSSLKYFVQITFVCKCVSCISWFLYFLSGIRQIVFISFFNSVRFYPFKFSRISQRLINGSWFKFLKKPLRELLSINVCS